MIDKYYKEFRVRDYMDEEGLNNSLRKDIIDCSLGTNPFIDDDLINSYLTESVCEINKYPAVQYELLKEELLKFYNDVLYQGVDKNNIAFGSGTMGTIRNLGQFLMRDGKKVLGCAPQFPRFISEVELQKGIYDYYKFEKKNNYKFVVEDFIKMIDNTYDVISIENPNNPTGQTIDINDIEKNVEKARENNIIVLVDEAYGDYMTKSNSAITLVNKYNNIVVIRSGSKFFGLPNHRVGYMFADKELIKIYNEIAMPFPFSDLSASIFIKALQNYSKIEDTKTMVREAKEKICNSIKKENYIYTDMEIPIFTIKSDKCENLTKKLMEEGIIAENCSYFINLDSTYARIRINKDYEKIIEILTRIL